MTRILVVEDESIVAADIAQRLKRSGYDVPAVAATGEAALRMTEELHPDLILMDILIKGEKDGIETAREIKDQFEIPLIFLTGQADESTVKRVRDTGHYGFLLKPIDTASLLPTVEMALIKHAFDVQLKESESRFRAVTDSAVEAIFSIDAQGTVIYWNKAAERTFGWTAEDIIGQSVTAIIPESAKAGFFKMLPALGTHGTYVPPSVQSWRRKDGTEFPAEPSFASWKTKKGTFATAIVRDISDRKRAEAEHERLAEDYQRQARMLEGMLSASADTIYLSDPEGRILYQNDAAARLIGFKRGEAIGKTMWELGLPADVVKKAEAQRNNVVATGQAQAGAVDYPSPDGIRSHEYVLSPVFNPRGDVESVVASGHDVTEQKRMLAAIAESEAQQKAIFELVQTGIVLIDLTTHKIVDINTTAANLFGAPKEAIIGSVCNRFICPAEVGRCPITDLGQTVDNAERVLLTADGKSRPILKSVSEITLGGHAYLLESFIDISDRKQMERDLLESEAYYRAIFESTATGLAIVEEDMTVAMVNSILEQLTGFSKNEVEGLKPWTDFVAPEDLELMKTFHRTRRRDEGSAPKGYEFRLLTKDGTRREAFLTVALIPGTQRSVVSIVDLTALKTAQEAVRKQAGMLDAAHDCIVIYDDVGTVTYWNRGAERLYGWTKQEAESQNVHALLQTTFPESREALWPKLMENGAWEGELIHVTRDGVPVTVTSSWTLLKDEKGNVSAILEISSDITERKKAELALADSEAKLRTTFASMADGIVINGLDRKVTDCNDAILRLTQRSREVIIGKPFTDLLAPEFRSKILETIPELLEKGNIRTNSKMLRKNGESVDVEANVSLITDAAGQPTAFLTVTRDVTERKKAELALQEAQKELRQRAAMLDAAHDCIVIFDDVGTVTYWNRGAERLYGWTKQEAESQNVHALLQTTFPESREALWPKLMENGAWEGELIHVTRDGVPITVTSSWTLLKDEKGNVSAILETCSDITEQKQADEALNESERHIRELTDALPVVVFETDATGVVMFINTAAFDMYGYSKEELEAGMSLFQLIAPAERGRIGTVLSERESWEDVWVEHTGLRKDGSTFPASVRGVPIMRDGTVVGIRGIADDITERKRVEETLASELAINSTIARLSAPLIAPTSMIEDIALAILKEAKGLTGSEAGFVGLIDLANRDMIAFGLTQMMVEGCAIPEEQQRLRFPIGPDGSYPALWGHALTTKKGFYTNAPPTHPASRGTPDGHTPLTRLLAAPALVGEDVVGQVAVANPGTDYTERDLRAVERLARVYALAIVRTRAEDTLKQAHDDVQALNEALQSANEELRSDIAERKKAELALAESEATLRITFATMVDGIVSGGLDWKVTDCNEGILRITQKSKEEVIGKPFTDLIAPEFRSKILETIPELMEKGNIRTDDKMLRKNGESVDVEANVSLITDAAGQPTAFLAVIRDITERKKAELALAESEATLRITFATMADGIVIVGLDEKVIDCNEAILRLTQRSREEILGKPSADLLAPEFRSQIPDARKFLVGSILTRTMPGLREKGGVRTDSQLLRKNGESVDIEANISVIEDAVGQPSALIIVARDVTERKKMEQQLNSTLADLQRSNAELEQFAYIASHDLQEPLRMIASYIQLIEEDYKEKLDADADQYIAFAVDGAKRMQTLINDLLAYSRVGTRGEPLMPTSMKRALTEAIANLEVAIEENHAVVTHDQLPTVLGDESQLIQLFQNLVGNAIKFKSDDAPTIHVGVEETKDDWVFSVRDNGIGIDMKYAERIFTIFQRLHSREEYAGTGIGLAVVKKIVERHGGHIWVESTPAKGSTFYFTLRKRGDSML